MNDATSDGFVRTSADSRSQRSFYLNKSLEQSWKSIFNRMQDDQESKDPKVLHWLKSCFRTVLNSVLMVRLKLSDLWWPSDKTSFQMCEVSTDTIELEAAWPMSPMLLSAFCLHYKWTGKITHPWRSENVAFDRLHGINCSNSTDAKTIVGPETFKEEKYRTIMDNIHSDV